MRRRAFSRAVVLSGTWPIMARAQQSAPGSRAVRIGILWHVDSTNDLLKFYRDALTETLKGLGYVEGKNLQIVERGSADGRQLRELEGIGRSSAQCPRCRKSTGSR
jgi:hypothetical protein